MAVIFMVEHGDTKYDEKGCAQGLLNSGLTSRGESQARGAARGLVGRGIDCVYCSPLARSKQTADIIADKIKAKVIVRQNLKPLDIGNLAGKKESAVQSYLEFYSKRPTLSFPEGESFGDFYDRALAEWKHQFADDDPVIAVVSHSRDFQLMKHWQKNGLDTDENVADFVEPNSAQICKATRSGNSVTLRKIQ